MKPIILCLLVCCGLRAQTAVFPGAVVTDEQLKIQVNAIQTALTASMTSTGTTATVASCLSVAANMFATIDQEIIAVSGCSGNLLSVDTASPGCTAGRACDNSIASSHSAGVGVYLYIDAWHHNALSAEIKAVESTLGVNLSNVTGAISVAPHNGTYTVLTGDRGKALTSNVAAAYTLPQAGSTGFSNGWTVYVQNVGGSGNITVTTTGSTFYGNLGSGSVGTLAPNTGIQLVSDGANWLLNDYTQGPVSVTIGGTANQITATGTCAITAVGTCILSLPSNLIIPNGATASTQTNGDNTTKVATDAFVQTAVAGAGGALAITSNGTPVSGSPATTADTVSGTGVLCTPTVSSSVWHQQCSADVGYLSTKLGINEVNAQTGTTYTVSANDKSKLITFNNSGSIAVTLPQGTGSFAAPFAFCANNYGAGTVTVTPATSTINNGASNLALTAGQGACVVTDPGGNYQLYSLGGQTGATGPSGATGPQGATGATGGFAPTSEFNTNYTVSSGDCATGGTQRVILSAATTVTMIAPIAGCTIAFENDNASSGLTVNLTTNSVTGNNGNTSNITTWLPACPSQPSACPSGVARAIGTSHWDFSLGAGLTGPTGATGPTGIGGCMTTATQTLASPAASITFSSIPATCKNLRLTIEARSAASATSDQIYFQVNGDSSAHYFSNFIYGTNGSTVLAGAATASPPSASPAGCSIAGATALAGTSGTSTTTFANYTGTVFGNKMAQSQCGSFIATTLTNAALQTLLSSWYWNSGTPAAISSISVFNLSGSNFATGSFATLEGF